MDSRRGFVMWNKTVVAIAVSALFVLYGSSILAQEKPIKIGIITSLTGPAAQAGIDVLNSIKMCIDEAKEVVAGRPIKLIIEDDGAKPPMGLAKARKLILEDGVHVLTGVLLGSVNGAVAPYANKQKVPLLTMASSPTSITYKKDMPYFFRMVPSGTQPTHPFGDWVYRKLGIREIVTLALDYTYGHDSVSSFQRTFEEAGGKVIQKIWIPMDVIDFAPYVSQINRGADGIFVVVTGSYALRFAKQFQEAGLKGKMKVVGVAPVTGTHQRIYAVKEPGQYIEFVHWRVQAIGNTPKPEMKELPFGGESPSFALKGSRSAYFKELGGFVDTPVYDGTKLTYGNKINGPAIIEEPTTTIVIFPGAKITVSRWVSYIMD